MLNEREEFEAWWKNAIGLYERKDLARAAFAAGRAALARSDARGAVAAWRAPNLSGSGDEWAYRDADDRFENHLGQPVGEALYTTPQSNGQKPALTDDQRKAIEWALGMASQHNLHKPALRALLQSEQANG